MTTKKVEEKGLRILGDYFEECERIDTHIPQNDKEPLWDGHLYLFTSEEQKAEQVYGRIPTQVKSLSKVINKNTVSYSVKKSALNTYKRDGGVLYFVIYINNEEGSRIYYSLLTPVIIKKYLRAPGTGETVPIKLSKVPIDKHRMTEDLFQFYFDCKKQTSSADQPIVELKDYFEKNGKRQFTVFAKSIDKVDDIFAHMQTHPLYMYATDEEKNVSFALGDGPVTIKIGRNIEQDVSVNGTPYFKGCTLFDEDGEQVITIGNFFTYRSGCDGKEASLNIKLEGHSNLAKITYLAFILALFKYKEFSIGSVTIPCIGVNPSPSVINKIKEELKILNQVKSLFSTLHVDGDINMDELSSGEITNLNAFYRGIVLKEPLSLKSGREKQVRFVIGQYVFYLMFYPCEDGKFQVRDFFTNEDVCCLLTENDVTTKSSRFTLPNVDQFAEASNFDYSGMIQSYEIFMKENDKVPQLANLDMLRMILAYDKTGGKKIKLLDAAEVLNNWFIEKGLFNDKPINEINKFQIIKRRRSFTDNETSRIIELSESSIPEDCKTACMLLLGNQTSAEYHFNKIPEDSKDYFMSLPIYHFWKNDSYK